MDAFTASQPAAFAAKVVTADLGTFVALSVAELVNVMAGLGYTQDGVVGPDRRAGLRAELQGAPIFSGITGPMWDGDGIRYEDFAVSAAVSL